MKIKTLSPLPGSVLTFTNDQECIQCLLNPKRSPASFLKKNALLLLMGFSLGLATVAHADSYTVNVTPGVYNVVGNQLDNPPNTLNTLFLSVPVTSQAATYNHSLGYTLATKKALGWNVNPAVNRGEALLLKPQGISTITLNGTSTLTAIDLATVMTFYPLTNWYFRTSQIFDSSNPTRQYTYHDITGQNPVDGVTVYKHKGGPVSVATPFDSPSDWQVYKFRAGAWLAPGAPTILAGNAVWIGPEVATIEGTVSEYDGSCNLIGPLKNMRVELSGATFKQVFTDAAGKYSFYVTAGQTYTVTHVPDPCTAYVPDCVGVGGYSVPIAVGTDHVTGRDFGIRNAGGITADQSVQLSITVPPHGGEPKRTPCCGDQFFYHIGYANRCAPTAAGSKVVLNLSGPTTFSSAVPAPSSVSADLKTVTWTLGALSVADLGLIIATVNVEALGPNCSQLAGTESLVSGTATIEGPVSGADSYIANNIATHTTWTKCAYDPNDKEVFPKGCGPQGYVAGNQVLDYKVHFQNLGAGPAYDVVVRDYLDDDLDISTLEVLGASHNNVFQLNGREMVWTFPNIFLPGAVDNEPGSHGFLTYRVKPLAALAAGTMITNMAAIYFDNNPAVLTPTTTNTITASPVPAASFAVASRQGSAGHTNDFTYTGGTAGATFLWYFGPDATPATSMDANPTGVVFGNYGMKNVSLQVSLGDCRSQPSTALLSVGQPTLRIGQSGAQVCLAWSGATYALQEAGSLEAPIVWQTINPAITQMGSTYSTCLNPTNGMRFYRLVDQP